MNNWKFKFGLPICYISIATWDTGQLMTIRVTKKLNIFSYWFIRLFKGNEVLNEMSAHAYLDAEKAKAFEANQKAAFERAVAAAAPAGASDEDLKDKVFS